MVTATIRFLAILICFGVSTTRGQINIAVASNMQFAIKDVASAFTQKTGIDCNVSVASSGKHFAQISNGADRDVFISARKSYIDSLTQSGKASIPAKGLADSPLIVWSNKIKVGSTMHMLREERIKKVAIANPKHAPMGAKALDCIRRETNINVVRRKLVFAENIAHVNHLVLSKAVDVGITSRSSVLTKNTRKVGSYLATTCGMVRQYITITSKNPSQKALAEKFVQFADGPEGKRILIKHGYIVRTK